MTARFQRLLAAFVLALGFAAPAVRALPVTQVSAAFDVTCAIVVNALDCWGYNANGQVGDGTTTTRLTPHRISNTATGVSTSGFHTCAVLGNGAYCWGSNTDGQLGDGTINQVLSAQQVPALPFQSGVTAVATGDLHSCAIQNGGLYCWGANGYGQLGTGNTTASRVPVAVPGMASGVTSITAGRFHTCAVARGVLYCWGRNDSGELGLGTVSSSVNTPTAVPGMSGTSVVEAGGSFTCAVKAGGAVCWGFNGNGQLGIGTSNGSPWPVNVSGLASGVTHVAAGSSYHACSVTNGAASCWGYNNAGQLGNPAGGGGTQVPIAVSGLASGVIRIGAGGLHTCSAGLAGVHCWGDNANGQLGINGTAPSNVPLLVVNPRAWSPDVVASPAELDFGGTSVKTTATRTVTLTNNGASTVTFGGLAYPLPFGYIDGNCGTVGGGTLAPGASCTLQATFTPGTATAREGFINVNLTSGQQVFLSVSGQGEQSLTTHYYRSILGREPDEGGKAFWNSEAARMQASGVNVNETWYAMAQAFYASAEYAAFNRDANGFVSDLYNTFFNRPADAGGLSFWAGQIAQGMPREVVLASFMFSSEFTTFTQGIFGNTQVRREIDTVGDFYRGLLGRLPDNGGLSFWVTQFRIAQCQGAAAVTAQAEAISSQFATGGEYAARARSNAQYVGDLYNAFLRRGGDLAGVQFWVSSLNANALTREQVRQQFVQSAEFQARVQQVIAQGCLP